MAEATLRQDDCAIDYTADAAITGGEVLQLKDGRAGVIPVDLANGALGAVQVEGVYRLAKTASIAILNGGCVFWDHSANKAHFKKVNDRDFYLGRAVADSAEAGTTVDVQINLDLRYDIDALQGSVLSVPVGTQVVGAFGFPRLLGGVQSIELTATNEAQKVDLLSVDGFALGANPIIEAIIRVPDGDAAGAGDFNIGVANGTHATDADAITEHLFFHIDGNSTTILAQSKDGTTTVAAVTTTKTYTAGSAVANRVELWIDLRDPTDAKLYVEGVEVLAATAWNVNAAAGPLFLLAHLEKTASTDTMRIVVDVLRARLGQQ